MWVYLWTEGITFDFQNDWDLGWTWFTKWGTSAFASWEWRYISDATTSNNNQTAIVPPQTMFDNRTLTRIKIWLYKKNAIATDKGVWVWPCTDKNLAGALAIWSTGSWNWGNPQANVYDGNSDHKTNTADATWEITQEWLFNDDWTLTLILNWSNTYNLWSYASVFRTSWTNKTFCLNIGSWGVANDWIRVRKVERETV